jgi:hypothetical protein
LVIKEIFYHYVASCKINPFHESGYKEPDNESRKKQILRLNVANPILKPFFSSLLLLLKNYCAKDLIENLHLGDFGTIQS